MNYALSLLRSLFPWEIEVELELLLNNGLEVELSLVRFLVIEFSFKEVRDDTNEELVFNLVDSDVELNSILRLIDDEEFSLNLGTFYFSLVVVSSSASA